MFGSSDSSKNFWGLKRIDNSCAGMCGIVINSPKVSKKTGNSIRAEAFAKKLTKRYSWGI
jgi:hypothetical protein